MIDVIRRLLLLFMIVWLPIQAIAASLPVCMHSLAPADDAAADERTPCHSGKSSVSSPADSVADLTCDDCESCHTIGASALPIDHRSPGCERVSHYVAVPRVAAMARCVPPPTPPPST